MPMLERVLDGVDRFQDAIERRGISVPVLAIVVINLFVGSYLLGKRALQTMHPSENHFSLLKLSPLNPSWMPSSARVHMDSLRKATTGLRVLAVPTLYPFLNTATFHRLDEIDPANPPDWIIYPQDAIKNSDKITTKFMFDFTFDGDVYHVHEVVR